MGYSESDHRRAQLKLQGLEDAAAAPIPFEGRPARGRKILIERLDGPNARERGGPDGYAKYQLRLW